MVEEWIYRQRFIAEGWFNSHPLVQSTDWRQAFLGILVGGVVYKFCPMLWPWGSLPVPHSHYKQNGMKQK